MKTTLTIYLLIFISIFCYGQTSSKFSNALIANAPCVDEGFEGLPNAPLTSPGWLSSVATVSTTGVLCSGAITYTPDASRTLVVSTPTSDAVLGPIPNSPLNGTKVLRLNRFTDFPGAKVSQTFSVTLSNFIYNYAYMGYITGSGHTFCQGAGVYIKFFDCSNTQINAYSKSMSVNTNPDAAYWGPTNGGVLTTSWVPFSVNLSAYIGSCVRVEIGAGGCIVTGHQGFCYYDAECSDKFVKVNNNPIGVSNYTSCSATATLSAISGFSTYLWQGPVNSGVNGSTLSSATPSVPGTYSVTVTTGTLSILQTLNLSFAGNPLLSISGNTAICSNQVSTTLQVSGNGINTYTWSSGSNSSSVVVFPVQNTVYSVSVTTGIGCLHTFTQQVVVNNSPAITISPATSNICIGQSALVSASAAGTNTYAWSNGNNNATISVSPTTTTIYSVVVTTSANCSNTAIIQVQVNAFPNFSLSVNSITICSGQSIPLSINASSVGANYLWSNGSSGTLNVVSPTVTTVYTASANALGCVSIRSATVTVNSLPQLQPGATASAICLGKSATLWADQTGTYSYNWSSGQTTNSISVSPSVNTVYSATVTAINGCSQVCTHTLGILPLPSIKADASHDSIFCTG